MILISRCPFQSITVYCSSSKKLSPHYYDAGIELGRAIAQNKWTLVYGGNSVGMMKSISDAARAGGGKVVGITPQFFVDGGCHDVDCHEFIVTNTMRERRQILEHRGDAFIALPGGLGTFEEFFEILAAKGLALHNKPIVVLNIAGYWNPLLAMIDHGIEQNFIKPNQRNLFHVADTVKDAIQYLQLCSASKPGL